VARIRWSGDSYALRARSNDELWLSRRPAASYSVVMSLLHYVWFCGRYGHGCGPRRWLAVPAIGTVESLTRRRGAGRAWRRGRDVLLAVMCVETRDREGRRTDHAPDGLKWRGSY